jgi:Flp pilus assembly protein TadG
MTTRHPSIAQRGTAAVEFSFLLFVLLLIGAGIFEFGRAFWYYDALAKATRDGARYLASADQASIGSVGVPSAVNLVVAEANAAKLSPALAAGNVNVSCNPACTDGTAPTDVTVRIGGGQSTSYTIDIGGVFPFIVPGAASPQVFTATLAPHTTMRYLN